MPTNKEKIADLLIRIFPYENGDDYHTTFELVNNTFSPFQQVDYLLNGIFKDVDLMNDSNSKNLKDETEIKNRKEQIYTNGKIIHPIYKINKKSNANVVESVDDNNDNDNDDDDDENGGDDDENGGDDDENGGDDEERYDDDEERYDDYGYDDDEDREQPKKRKRSSRRGGNTKNKKQHRKTKKHSKK